MRDKVSGIDYHLLQFDKLSTLDLQVFVVLDERRGGKVSRWFLMQLIRH